MFESIGISEIVTYAFLFVSLYFEVFLFISFLDSLSRKDSNEVPAGALPRVAIVVPCYNEEEGIAATLNSLLCLQYPLGLLEILVVNDGSTDSTLSIAKTFETDLRVKVYSKANEGKYSALNLALAHTNADIIGCLDADSTVEPYSLMHIVPLFSDPKVCAVTPGIHAKKADTFLRLIQHVEYRLNLFNRFVLASLGSAFITPGSFSFFRTSTVRALGGWRHAHSTEDLEMALRMQQNGIRIVNAPGAVVYTDTPATLRALIKQRVRWTYGFVKNMSDYRHMIASRNYGDLGIVILPAALISICAAMYLVARVLVTSTQHISSSYMHYTLTGDIPTPSFNPFFFNTSAVLFLSIIAIVFIVILISAGSWIGTNSKKIPLSTPLFLIFYSFLAPLWLTAALARAAFNTGVKWR